MSDESYDLSDDDLKRKLFQHLEVVADIVPPPDTIHIDAIIHAFHRELEESAVASTFAGPRNMLHELLAPPDASVFVDNAYRQLYNRPPAPNEHAAFVDSLRAGTKTKYDVLGRIRYSRKGRQNAVPVPGLILPYLVSTCCRIPVLGYMIRLGLDLFKLPHIVRSFERMHEVLAHRINMADNTLASQQARVEDLFNRMLLLGNKQERVALTIQKELERLQNHAQAFTESVNIANHKADRAVNVLGLDKQIGDYYIVKGEADADLVESENPHDYRSASAYYYEFENRYRGSTELIYKRQKKYCEYINQSIDEQHPFLDFGCGRGEFLEVLKDQGIPAVGVDMNDVEIEMLKTKGYQVVLGDGVAFLKNTEQTFSGISAFQVIEHLTIPQLRAFVESAFDKLVPGGVIILETVNPLCSLAMANFYLDETHVKPVPAERMRFMLEWYGFRDVNIVYSSPAPEHHRGAEMPMNYQDYAAIGVR